MSKQSADDTARVAKRKRLDYAEDAVIVLVGEEEARFAVHKNFVCKGSSFFRTALSERWRESGQQPIKLQETEPDLFLIYVNWLYTGEVEIHHEDDSCQKKWHPKCRFVSTLTGAYILGDFLGDTVFCNAVTDSLLDTSAKLHVYPTWSFVKTKWAELPENSGYQRLLVDFAATCLSRSEFNEVVDDLPQGLLAAIARVLMTLRPSKYEIRRPKDRNAGYYHDQLKEADVALFNANAEELSLETEQKQLQQACEAG